MSGLEYRFPETKIIKWNQELHKFKVQYQADLGGEQKERVRLQCTPAEMQQHMDRVIRYILHHRDQLKPPKLQTDYIQVDCRMKVWPLPSMVHFEQYGREVQAYPNMFCLTVKPRISVKSIRADGRKTQTIGADLGEESQDKDVSACPTVGRGTCDDNNKININETDMTSTRRVTDSRSEPRLNQHPGRCRDKSPDSLSGFDKLRRDCRMRQRRYSEVTGLEGDGDFILGDIAPRPPQVYDSKVQKKRVPTEKYVFEQVAKTRFRSPPVTSPCVPDRPRPPAELVKTAGGPSGLGKIKNNVTTRQGEQSEKPSKYIEPKTPPNSGFLSPSRMDRAKIEEEELAEQRSLQELAKSSAKSTRARKRRKSMLETVVDVLFVTPAKRIFGPLTDTDDD